MQEPDICPFERSLPADTTKLANLTCLPNHWYNKTLLPFSTLPLSRIFPLWLYQTGILGKCLHQCPCWSRREKCNLRICPKIFKISLTPPLKVLSELNMFQKRIKPPHFPHPLLRWAGRDSHVINCPNFLISALWPTTPSLLKGSLDPFVHQQ